MYNSLSSSLNHFQCHKCIEIIIRTNESTCILNGLKLDLVLINQESISNSIISQFDSVQVIHFFYL